VGSASGSTKATIRQLAGKRTRVVYNWTCTQQVQSGDCGCFAFAYATTIVLGGDPASYEYVASEVQSHPAGIVRNQQLEQFNPAVPDSDRQTDGVTELSTYAFYASV